jgi:hypothetical protein
VTSPERELEAACFAPLIQSGTVCVRAMSVGLFMLLSSKSVGRKVNPFSPQPQVSF